MTKTYVRVGSSQRPRTIFLIRYLPRLVGQDATEAFYGLHLHEVLERPQYKRLVVGTVRDEKPQIYSKVVGQVSDVPYAEPTWLSAGYHSPYFKEVSVRVTFSRRMSHICSQSHRKLQSAIRTLVDEIIYPEAQVRLCTERLLLA